MQFLRGSPTNQPLAVDTNYSCSFICSPVLCFCLICWCSSVYLDKYLLLCEKDRDNSRKEDHVLTSISCSSSAGARGFLFLLRVEECVFLWTVLISFVSLSCATSCHVCPRLFLILSKDISAPILLKPLCVPPHNH